MARQKLLYHASQADHNLRCLTLHANLLDNLLLELNNENERNAKSDRDTLPTLAAYHAHLHASTEPVILVTEGNEDAEDEEDDLELPAFPNLKSTPTSPPMLTHDTDSDSEYSDDSDPELDDSDGFEFSPIHGSPTTSISDDDSARFASNQNKDELSLHRTPSHWNLQKKNY